MRVRCVAAGGHFVCCVLSLSHIHTPPKILLRDVSISISMQSRTKASLDGRIVLHEAYISHSNTEGRTAEDATTTVAIATLYQAYY